MYPELRANQIFAERRAEGIWAGISDDVSGYRIYNLATKRMITRRFADCVFREPDLVVDYVDTVVAAEKAFVNGELDITAQQRQSMFEPEDQMDTMIEIRAGNDPNGYIGNDGLVISPVVGSLLPSDGAPSACVQPAAATDVQPDSAGSEDEDSQLGGESDSGGEENYAVAEVLGKRKLNGGLVEYLIRWVDKPGELPYDKTWEPAHNLTLDLIRDFEAQHSALMAGVVQVAPPKQNLEEVVQRQDKVIKLPPAQYRYAIRCDRRSQTHKFVQTEFEHALCVHAVKTCERAEQHFKPVVSKNLPDLVIAQTGAPLPQRIAVDMTDTAKERLRSEQELSACLHQTIQAFMVDFGLLECPRSWRKAEKSEQAPQWRAGDDVEMQRMQDFDAYERITLSEARRRGLKIEHLVRVLRVKPDELKVRWAYDEARAKDSKEFDTYASVVRLQTSRLLNLKAANLGRRVLRGDLTSAFLHVKTDVPFCTYFPEGRPESEDGKYVMLWKRLVYGKGNAPRGLRQDMKTTLEALGFVEQTAADECLYVHPEREIDLGLYVDDIEMSASEENLDWLKGQLAKRYLIKFLGYNSKGCEQSSNKSKTYVGVRTEIDHASKVVTQDQQELIERGARKFQWDGRKRWSPPVTKGLVPLSKDAKICPKFHTQFRGKVGFLAHVALVSRPDVAYHAVELSRQLVSPSAESDKFADEVLQFLFSTADQKLTFHCKEELHKTLIISSDASLADTADAKTTGGWVSLCGGAAWSWAVETLRLQVLSSTEAEYCETASACKEVLAQERLFAAFRLSFPKQYPVLVDNHSAIALACGPAVHYQRTKHIATKFHFQRQLMLEGVIRLQHQATHVQFSDILTKSLGSTLHRKHRRVLFGMDPVDLVSIALPDSQKVFIRRHNELIQQRVQKEELRKAYEHENEKDAKKAGPSTQEALVASVQALLAVVAAGARA